MAGVSKKSTKKFVTKHLKDTIDKRKEHAKIKQRQQIKAKRKARNASDNARVEDVGEKPDVSELKQKSDAFSKMSVDEFFQSGFELPEKKKEGKKKSAQNLGKRKRDDVQASSGGDSDSSSSVEEDGLFSNEEEQGSDEGMDLDTHKDDLDALAEKDPDFYKYLKENDAELLDFKDDHLELSDTEETPKKKRKQGRKAGGDQDEEANDDGSEVTIAMVKKWKVALSEDHSLRAMRQVALAFRAAAHINSQDEKGDKYSIPSPEVYHEVLLTALENVPNVLAHHLPVKEMKSGNVRVATDSKKYRTLTPLLKSHASSIHHLLENLSDAPTIKLTLSSLIPLLPYILSFKKVLKSVIKSAVEIWSEPSSNEATRITAFLLIRRLAVISDPSLREAVLKTAYQGVVKGSRNTNSHTIAGINLMKNSAAELWGLDPEIGYTTGFKYIRQLAVHLRTSVTQPTKDSYKEIYNWQYVHSLDFWSRVLAAHCFPATTAKNPPTSALQPLIYPLVQITLGALRLIPTPTYFPLRFHLTRSLLRVSLFTNTYIPLAPSLLEVLTSTELSKPPKPSTLKPLDFNTTLRAPNSYIRTRVYQDGLGIQISELLVEFFSSWSKHITFPELVIPPTVVLKRWLKSANGSSSSSSVPPGSTKKTLEKGNKNSKLNSSIALLVTKLDLNARWVEEKRKNITFAPGNREEVDSFLKDVKVEDTPLGAFAVTMRKQREERAKVLDEGRRERDAKGGRIKSERRHDVADDDDDGDGEEDD